MEQVFVNYVRAIGEEADVIRLCQIALDRGLIFSALESITIWQWYSQEYYSADWLAMDDIGINRAIDKFMQVFAQ